MESADLARWQRFAAKGGIGKAIALVDRVAEQDGDLMFLKDDEVTVLMQLPQTGFYLGFCEGVVGRFAIADVQVHGKLKRAVMARRPASGNPASPTASPISLPTTPNPVVPHTTYRIDGLTHDRAPSNSLTGVSAWLASQPPAHRDTLPGTEIEHEHKEAHRTESISSRPSSPIREQGSHHSRINATPSSPLRSNSKSPPASPRSPLRVDTTAPPAQQRERESQSLASLASTEASPLSDASAYSFHRRPDQGPGTEIHRPPEQGEDDITSNEDMRPTAQHVLSQDAESSLSRASSPSVGDPFQHDDETGPLASPDRLPVPTRNGSGSVQDTTSSSLTSAEMVKTPVADGGLNLDVQVSERQEDGLYSGDRGSKYSLDSNTRDGTRAAARLSDGEVGIGLSLIGGMFGAGARGGGGGGSDSESDYGEPSESSSRRTSHKYGGLSYGQEDKSSGHGHDDDDVSLYRNDSVEGHDTRAPQNATFSGNVTPHANGTVTPTLANGSLRTSQSAGSSDSRSSTPPFGFELEPTTVIAEQAHQASEHEGTRATPVDDANVSLEDASTPLDTSQRTLTESPADAQVETSRSTPVAAKEEVSDDESDYGEVQQPVRPSIDSPPRPSFESLHNVPDDGDFDLPPVRPPYHRASNSVRSITSSDAGGYYDDGIYDHYRYSQASMAARSIRMSTFGAAEEVPPLPNEAGLAERRAAGDERHFSPLNISEGGSQGSRSPGSQAQFSPSLHGPKSPRSPLAQAEPASPRSLAGSILQAQAELKHNDEKQGEAAKDGPPPLSVVTTGLTSSGPTTGLTPVAVSTVVTTSPGGLAPPLSPIPSAPPSPALSSNLASSLRQAIEQQHTTSPEPELKAEPESETKSIDEDKPILLSPAMVNSPPQQRHSGYEPSPIASLQRRPSQFAPHPNAPKPAHMFNSNYPPPAEPAPAQPQTGPQHMRLHDALQLVAHRLRTAGVAGGPPTIHGRTHSDLGLSSGPVPISFVFDPDGRSIVGSNRPIGLPPRMMGGAQRSASMNVPAPAGGNTGEYVGSKLRPRSRSFSSVPQEQLVAIQSAGEPSTPRTPLEPKYPMNVNTPPAPPSPLAQPPTQPAASPVVPDAPSRSPVSPVQSAPSSPVKQVAPPPNPNTPTSGSKGPFRGLRQVASSTMMRVGLQGSSISLPRQSSDNIRQSPVDSPSFRRRQSDDLPRPTASALNVHTPSPTSTSPMASSSISLHSKVSSTGLRLARAGAQTTDTPTTPLSPVGSHAEETVHFNDMDFDMVKPMRGRLSIVRTSEDGRQSLSRSSQHSELPRTNQEDDGQDVSPTSPTTASLSHPRTPSAATIPMRAGSHNSLTTSDSIAAHISREQRWISTMQTVPSSTVRRNKKIKKLLLEGVPASVRGVVWLYLTDSKARRMAGLYSQLAKRGKVPATAEIVKDVERCFTGQPHLQAPDGPVTTILQSYLAMVPDVTYSQGLCQTAGNLLMHSPEEDAFWTFVALMDKHLRGYCAVNSLQMEADSVFFAKALESNDSQLAAKLFRELGLHANDFVKPWILSGFVGVVPLEYSSRIWDIFLFEGAPFLFRVALVLLGYLKKQIMALSPKSSLGALDCLLSISPQVLPADPDQLINLAYSVKFKEDDMRKMRPKTEAQLRKEPGFTRPVLTRDTIRK